MEYHSSELAITQQAVAAYARLTDDFNPIHMDPAFAGKTAMGGVIAHGTLSLALVWEALGQAPGFDPRGLSLDIRFVKPVRLGSTVRAGAYGSMAEGFEVWVCNSKDEKVIAGVATPRAA